MKILFSLVSGLLLSLSGICQNADTLVYQTGRKLTWQDFKGKPRTADRNNGAEIKVTINLKVKKVSFWTGKTTYDAFAVAFAHESWVKPAYKDDYTLAHEQLHFDIAHIYAETLEMEINNLPNAARQKKEVAALVEKYVKEMSAYQALYDRETSGGNNKAKQKEWAQKIEKDLNLFGAR